MRTTLTLLACLIWAPMTAGCHRSSEICDIICECEKCSDHSYDECIIKFDAAEDFAAAYDCSDQYNQAYDCVAANSKNCVANDFSPDPACDDDIQKINECTNSNSSL